jgi:hypothetical protein
MSNREDVKVGIDKDLSQWVRLKAAKENCFKSDIHNHALRLLMESEESHEKTAA